MFKYAKLCVRTDRPSGNVPKVRVSVKASYTGISTYDYTVVQIGTKKLPDSENSGSGFCESGSKILF
jgi:hypothetical protein